MKNKLFILLVFLVIYACSFNSGFQFIEKPKDCYVAIDRSNKLLIKEWSKRNNIEIDWDNSSEINHDFLRCDDSVNYLLNDIRYNFQRLIKLVDSHSIANKYSLKFNYNVYYYRDSLNAFINREDLNKLNINDFELAYLSYFGIIGSSYDEQLMEKEYLPLGYNYVYGQYKELKNNIMDIINKYNSFLINNYNVIIDDLSIFDKGSYNHKRIAYYLLTNKHNDNQYVIKIEEEKIIKVK